MSEPMIEYKLLANLPFPDPETDAIVAIAAALGEPVCQGPEGAPEVNEPEFLIYGFLPDCVDREAVTDLFGLDTNLTLVFTDPEGGTAAAASPIAQGMMKAAVLLAAVSGARGVIVTDYRADAIILRFEDGQLTLNQQWEGWQAMPDALAVIPEPRHLESLRGRS